MTGTPAPGPELIGRAAAPGLAAGPVVVVDTLAGEVAASGDPHTEAANLAAALDAASAQIAGLMEMVEPDAAEMLEFQMAMLEDEELTAPARAAIAGGASAAAAFAGALDAAIADYRASDDEYFRARSADLAVEAARLVLAEQMQDKGEEFVAQAIRDISDKLN